MVDSHAQGPPHCSFLLTHDRPGVFAFASLQSGTAALFVAGQLEWPWKAAVIARVLPGAVLDCAYDVIARNRYRVFGRLEQCVAPRPEFRGRFIE